MHAAGRRCSARCVNNVQSLRSYQGRNFRVSKLIQLTVQHAVHRFFPAVFPLPEVIDYRYGPKAAIHGSCIQRRHPALPITQDSHLLLQKEKT